jgi:GDP-L-fucose synthase
MSKIFIAGHKGMVGSAIYHLLKKDENIITTIDRKDLDLTNQAEVSEFFNDNQFDQVYIAAAKVGGILANHSYPADFIYQNLMIQSNIINSAYSSGIKKLLFLGSSCIYPRLAKQPIKENDLLSGKLEPTNEAYAIAKIAGIKMCESYNRQYDLDYRSVMPTNLYGPGDNYHQKNSHVVPALIRRFHESKIQNLDSITLWGSGRPLREFLHVYDMAAASVFLMNLKKNKYDKFTDKSLSHINVGSGEEYSIKNLAEIISNIVGYDGDIIWDKSKPDGTPRKFMDGTKLKNLGWSPSFSLEEGLKQTYLDYKNNIEHYNAS